MNTKITIAKYALLLMLGFVYSCETKGVDVKSTEMKINGMTIDSFIIDSCEYIGYVNNSGSQGFMAHKGNCKFCKERK